MTYTAENEGYLIKFKGIKNEFINSLKKLKNHIKNGTRVNLIATFKYCQIRKASSDSIFVIHKHKKSFYKKRIILPDLTTKPINGNTLNFDKIEQNNKKLILKHLGC